MFTKTFKCTKCWNRIPLKYGLVSFGCVNVVFSFFVFGALMWLAVNSTYSSESFDDGYQHFEIALPVLMYFMGIIFNALLVVAAHKENVTLLKIYFYCGVLTTVAMFMSLVMIMELIFERSWSASLITFSFAFLGIAIQIYVLTLVKSQMNRLRHNQQLCFLNHTIDELNQSSDWFNEYL